MNNIKTNRMWSIDSVRKVCVNNNLYTLGDNEEYEHMLTWVNRMYPNLDNMAFVAENILKHSEAQELTNILYLLENNAVTTTFEIV